MLVYPMSDGELDGLDAESTRRGVLPWMREAREMAAERSYTDDPELVEFADWLSGQGFDAAGTVTFAPAALGRYRIRSLRDAVRCVRWGFEEVMTPRGQGFRGPLLITGEYHKSGIAHVHLALSTEGFDPGALLTSLETFFTSTRGWSRFCALRSDTGLLYALKDTLKNSQQVDGSLYIRTHRRNRGRKTFPVRSGRRDLGWSSVPSADTLPPDTQQSEALQDEQLELPQGPMQSGAAPYPPGPESSCSDSPRSLRRARPEICSSPTSREGRSGLPLQAPRGSSLGDPQLAESCPVRLSERRARLDAMTPGQAPGVPAGDSPRRGSLPCP